MPRPVKKRRICEMPRITEFVPSDNTDAEIVEMTIDEFETIRLIDKLGMSQEDCAIQMDVARTTIQSIYTSARSKLAEVLVDGKRLRIAGGSYDICPKASGCCGKDCRRNQCGNVGCSNNKYPGCSSCGLI